MRRARGFTLIEVLVALAIVTIGMAAVLGAITSSADTVSYLRDKTFAQWVGLNQIATLRLSGQMTAPGNSDGDTDYAGRTWHWRQEVTQTEVPGVVRIDIRIRPKDVKVDDEDKGWFTTVTGIQGDAVGTPNGFQPNWGVQSPLGPAGVGQQAGIGQQTGVGQQNVQGLGQSNQQGLSPMQSAAPMVMPAGQSAQGLGSPITLGNDQQSGSDSDQPTPPPTNPPPSDQQSPPENPQ